MARSGFIVTLLFASTVVMAEVPSGPNDFPQWRGPQRNGISSDKGLLQSWPEGGPKVAWQVDDVGVGYSSVAIKDGLIVTMGDLTGVEHIIALKVSDGSRVWAVQPQPLEQSLAEKVNGEFKNMDQNADGKIDEVEGLSRLGWDFQKYDKFGDGNATARAAVVFAGLDEDNNGQLTYSETRKQFRDQFSRMDSADKEKATELAERRAKQLIEHADEDSDGKVSMKESRKNYLDRIFRRADARDPQTKKSDEILTSEELIAFFVKNEAGQDGILSADELTAYYEANVKNGDGQLTRDELEVIYGGYRNGMGDGPRGTPTIDGNLVYAEGGNGDVTCLDLRTGKTVWHINLTTDLGGGRPGWGFSESPLVVGDLVIVTPGGKNGTLAALDKLTGNVVWQSKENTEAAHYSSPILATIQGVEQVVQFARKTAFGVSLADGKVLWQYSGANNGTANCCTPIVDQDHVFVASAYGTGGGLAKISSEGGIQSASEVYFEKKMGIHHGGIVKIGDFMYTNGGGALTCIHFLTGEIAWQDRSVGKGSLVAADGMLYVLSENQQLALVEASPEDYREHGRMKMEGQGRPSWAHPVVAGGRLYVRDQQMLTAYELR